MGLDALGLGLRPAEPAPAPPPPALHDAPVRDHQPAGRPQRPAQRDRLRPRAGTPRTQERYPLSARRSESRDRSQVPTSSAGRHRSAPWPQLAPRAHRCFAVAGPACSARLAHRRRRPGGGVHALRAPCPRRGCRLARPSAPRRLVTAPSASACRPRPARHHLAGSASAERHHPLYTSVTQATVDAVVAAYKAANPEVSVNVFRAPTGELAGKIADGAAGRGDRRPTCPVADGPAVDPGVRRPGAAQDLDSRPGRRHRRPATRSDAFWGTRLPQHGDGRRRGRGRPAPSNGMTSTNAGLQGRRRHPRSGVRRVRVRGPRLLRACRRASGWTSTGTQGERRDPGESARRRDDRRRRGPVQGRDDARQLGAGRPSARAHPSSSSGRPAERSRCTARSPS